MQYIIAMQCIIGVYAMQCIIGVYDMSVIRYELNHWYIIIISNIFLKTTSWRYCCVMKLLDVMKPWQTWNHDKLETSWHRIIHFSCRTKNEWMNENLTNEKSKRLLLKSSRLESEKSLLLNCASFSGIKNQS